MIEHQEQLTVLGEPQKTIGHQKHPWWVVLCFIILLSGGFWVYTLALPPNNFAKDTLIEIPEGYSLQSIALLLEEKSIIRSPLYFIVLVTHYGKEKNIPAGTFLFKQPASVSEIARRMALGDHGIETRKITLPEGFTIKEMSQIIAREIPQFDTVVFLNETKEKEGYLFPDTYFFFTTATSGEVALALEDNFITRTEVLRQEAGENKKQWANTIIMASILEREAVTPEDRRIVSGILSQRLQKGMRLQIDAPFFFLSGKGSLELTTDDLKIDSPYNTYRYAGLPLGPIGNPGLDAIDAALHPTSTPYLYYLSGRDGTMHYAKTFEEHKVNKAKYLR